MSATESAVRQSLLSLAARKTGGFRSAAEAAEDMMHEVNEGKDRVATSF